MQIRREEPSPAEAAIVASRAFGIPLTPAYKERVASVIEKGYYYAARTNEGQLIGFLVARSYGSLNYIDGTAVLPKYQAQNLAQSLGLAALRDFPAPFIALVTQSVYAYRSAAKWCSTIFPKLGQADLGIPESLRDAAKILVENELRPFPIIPKFYPLDFYRIKPVSRDPITQRWWDSLAEFDNGDAIYIVGELAPSIKEMADVS